MISVERFDGSPAEWNAFVSREPMSTHCHAAEWWPIVRDVFGHECVPLAAYEDGRRICGVLPLVDVRSRLFGSYLISMPFLNAGGPVGREAACSALADAARREGTSRRVKLVELRNRHAAPNGDRITSRKITVHLTLRCDADTAWHRFHSKLRSQIRRATREQFAVRFGADQWAAFYSVFARNMRALGTPVLPREVFRRIAAAFPASATFAVVYDGEQPIAAGCGFAWNGEFELTWASALSEYNRRAPNMLLYWSLIERAANEGFHTFDFGRCTPGSGTHRFKQQWGGHDVPLPWTQWSADGTAAPPSPTQRIYRVAAMCWRRLPLAVANRVGPVIATQLP